MQHRTIFSLICLSLGAAVVANLNKDDVVREADPIAETPHHAEISAADNALQPVEAKEADPLQPVIAMHTASPPSSSMNPISRITGCKRIQGLPRASLRHIEGKGIGYGIGYTSLDLFLGPDRDDRSFFPFLDFRGHLFDNGKFAANAGFGFRKLTATRIWGMNTYYDYRNSQNKDYNQVGIGFESLGTTWDFRANGYLPVGETHTKWGHARFDRFAGNHFFVKQRQSFAMKGIDTEAGAHFNQTKDWDFYAGAGPYYFGGQNKNAWGGKVRLSSTYKDYIYLEMSGSYDNVFKNIGQIQVGLSLPFGLKSYAKRKSPSPNVCSSRALLEDRMIQPVIRQEIIVEDRRHRSDAAIDPATGLPYTVYFVDNTSNSAGTFESPYPTFLEALNASAEGDIIYVLPGDGTTAGLNALATPFQLKTNQQILGAAAAHPFTTTLGAIEIPPLFDQMPYFTADQDVSVIDVANNNTISGLHIVVNGAAGTTPYLYCIGAGSGTVTNLTVMNNLLETTHSASGNEFTSAISFVETFSTIQGNIRILNNTFNIGPENDNNAGETYAILIHYGDSSSIIENNSFNGIFNGSYLPNLAIKTTAADGSYVTIDINKNNFTTFRRVLLTYDQYGDPQSTFFDISGFLNFNYNTVRNINESGLAALDLGPAGTATDPIPAFTFTVNYNQFSDFGALTSAIRLISATPRASGGNPNTNQTVETVFNCIGNSFINTPVGSTNSIVDIRPQYSAKVTCVIENNYFESFGYGTATSAYGISINQPTVSGYTGSSSGLTEAIAKVNGNQFYLTNLEAVRMSNNVASPTFPSKFCLQFRHNYAPSSTFNFFKNSPQTFTIEPLVGNNQIPRHQGGSRPTPVAENYCQFP